MTDDDPYERLLRDADFAEAVTAAHTGRWAVPDALWWRQHPELASPDGVPSPVARLRELQHRVYAAGGDAAGDPATAERMRALEAEIASERAALAEALTIAGRSSAVKDAVPGAAALVDHADEAPGPGESGAGASARPARRAVLAGALLGALLVGWLLGSQLPGGSSVAAATPSPSAPSPAPTETARVATERPVLADLVFVAEQAAQDLPAVPVSQSLDPQSFRYLGSAGWSDDREAMAPSPYYAARGAGGMLCLVAVPEGQGPIWTCALESGFPTMGLRLSWEGEYTFTEAGAPPDLAGESLIGDATVIWNRDGTVQSEWTSR